MVIYTILLKQQILWWPKTFQCCVSAEHLHLCFVCRPWLVVLGKYQHVDKLKKKRQKIPAEQQHQHSHCDLVTILTLSFSTTDQPRCQLTDLLAWLNLLVKNHNKNLFESVWIWNSLPPATEPIHLCGPFLHLIAHVLSPLLCWL